MADEILALLLSLAPGLVELAKKFGVDLRSVKRLGRHLRRVCCRPSS